VTALETPAARCARASRAASPVAWIVVLDPRLIPDRATRPTLRNLLSTARPK
jgi:hypothetical protein